MIGGLGYGVEEWVRDSRDRRASPTKSNVDWQMVSIVIFRCACKVACRCAIAGRLHECKAVSDAQHLIFGGGRH